MTIKVEDIKKVVLFDLKGSGYTTTYTRYPLDTSLTFLVTYNDSVRNSLEICERCGSYHIVGETCINNCETSSNPDEYISEDDLIEVVMDVYDDKEQTTGICINDIGILYI